MKLLRRLASHLTYFREAYFLLPLFFLGILGALYFARFLTGRAPIEDPSAELIGALQGLTHLVLLIPLIGFAQEHLLGYRGAKENASLADDIFDACVFFSLLFAFAYLSR